MCSLKLNARFCKVRLGDTDLLIMLVLNLVCESLRPAVVVYMPRQHSLAALWCYTITTPPPPQTEVFL